MSLTPSNMIALGSQATDFSLINTIDGHTVTASTYAHNKPMLVAFICNHCPYVIHVLDSFVTLANQYQQQGVAVIAISANDVTTHPDDAPEKMQQLAIDHDFRFPYCFDESQAVAKAYDAACTPDFYLYNAQHELVYRGRYDASTPGTNTPVTGNNLRAAIEALLHQQPQSQQQHASLGCNIKWKST